MSVTDDSAPAEGDAAAAAPSGAPVRRRHTARNAAIVVGVVMVALVALLATRGTNQPLSSKIVGQAAPTFTGDTTSGQQFNLASHRGEWVLVNFFATWCVPCQLEHPELVKFEQEHLHDPVQVVSVAFSDQSDAIKAFFAQKGGTWPVVTSDNGSIALDYGVTGVPETYIVAPSGLVIGRLEGVTATELDQIIENAGGMAVAEGA
jgi:cytochrome c biogenesis protein CcmG/thiol:disulfide interchange protein DsbE